MSRTDLQLLADAVAYARPAPDDGGGLTAGILAEARQPLYAALYGLAILGEALGRISPEIRSLAPDIPGRGAIGPRNHVIHACWQIDPTIIADVLEHRLPALIDSLDELIEVVERAAP